MHGYALAAFALLILGGVLRPSESPARALIRRFRGGHAGVKPPWDAPPAPAAAPPSDRLSLNPIELALIAEYSLEMARANEAVAEDPSKQLETRRRASEVATAWRGRAQLFQMQARCQSAEPIIPAAGVQWIRVTGLAYTGPERRQKMRRTQTRRTESASASRGSRGHDRRAQAERRRRDRRSPEPAPR